MRDKRSSLQAATPRRKAVVSGWRCYPRGRAACPSSCHALRLAQSNSQNTLPCCTCRHASRRLTLSGTLWELLCGAVGLLADAVANKNGVGNADDTVVDATGVRRIEDLA